MAKTRSNYLQATEIMRDRDAANAGLKEALQKTRTEAQAHLAKKKAKEEEERKKKAKAEEERKKAEAEVAEIKRKEALTKKQTALKSSKEEEQETAKELEKSNKKDSKDLGNSPARKIGDINPLDVLGSIKNDQKIMLELENASAIDVALEEFNKQIGLAPKTFVESTLQNSLDPSAYEKYKAEKTEYEKLQEKTFAGLREIMHREQVKDSSFEVKSADPWYKKAAKNSANWFIGVKSGIASFAGAALAKPFIRLTQKEEARLNELEAKLKVLEVPVLKEQRKIFQEEYDILKSKHGLDKLNWVSMEADKVDLANWYEDALKEYDNAIEGGGLYKGLVKGRLGVLDAPSNFRVTRLINKAREEGEESLTEIERDLIRAYHVKNRVESVGLNNNKNYAIGQSLRQSGEFLLEVGAAGKVLSGVGRLAAPTSKMAKAMEIGKELTKPLLMPSMVNQTTEKLNADIFTTNEEGKTEVFTTQAQKEAAVEKLHKQMVIYSSKINQLESRQDRTEAEEEVLNELRAKRSLTEQDLMEASAETERIGFGKALFTTYQNILKDNLAEKYVGAAWDKAMPLVGNFLSRVKPVKYVAEKTKAIDIGSKVNDFLSASRKVVDDKLFNTNKLGKVSESLYAHVGPGKVLHSIPGEMVEEIAVQLTPVIGEDYAQQLNELASPDFYTNVLASTVLMGGSFSVTGAAFHYGKLATNSEYRDANKKAENRKELLRQQYKGIDDSVTNDGLAQVIGMNVPGSIYNIEDYDTKIAMLRDPKLPHPLGLSNAEKAAAANNLEKQAFTNMALHAVQTGTTKEFIKSINMGMRNANLHPETHVNMQNALAQVESFQEIYDSAEGWVNAGTIISEKIRAELTNQSMSKLQSGLSAKQTEIKKALENVASTESLRQGGDTEISAGIREAYQKAFEGRLSEVDPKVLGSLAKAAETNSHINAMLEYGKYLEDTRQNKESIQKTIDYETNPRNYKEIVKREFAAKKNASVASATMENAQEVKAELAETGHLDPQTTSEINEAAVESTMKQPITPATENTTVVGEVEGSTVENTQAPVVENTPPDSPLLEVTPELNQTLQNIFGGPLGDYGTSDNIEVEEEDHFQYAMMPANLEDPGVQKVINDLAPAISGIVKNQPALTFEAFVASLMDNSVLGPVKVKQNFDAIRKAWEKGSKEVVSDSRVNALHDSIFLSDASLDTIKQALGGTLTENVTTPATEKEVASTDTVGEPKPEKATPQTVKNVFSSGARPVKGTERRYHGVGLKLGGVLGIEYNRNPETGEYVDVDDEVLEAAKAFMDYRNFQPGDKVEVVLHTDYILENDGNNVLTIWEDTETELPTKVKTTFKDRLVEVFGNVEGVGMQNGTKLSDEATWGNIKNALEDYASTKNPNHPIFQGDAGLELLKIFPTGVPNTNNKYSDSNQETLLGGLNDYYWWNNGNVVLFEDTAGTPLYDEREERLEKNRAINLAARQMMLQGGGSINLTVETNEDATNNTRKDGGFHSILDNFDSIEDFSENATLAVFQNGEVIHYKDTSSTVLAKIGDKEIRKENIINYESSVRNLLGASAASGRVVMVVKVGPDKYSIHQVITNHKAPEKVQQFERINDNKVRLIYHQFIKKWQEEGETDKVEAVNRWFISQGLPALDANTINYLAGAYPVAEVSEKETKSKKNKKGATNYKQDFKYSNKGSAGIHAKAFSNPKKPIKVPDLDKIGSIDKFISDILAGKEIPTIDVRELALSNIHTNLKFTKIEKGGKSIYTYNSQPKMLFGLENKAEAKIISKVEKTSAEIEEARLEGRKATLIEKVKETQDEGRIAEYNRELASIESNLQEVKKATKEEEVGVEESSSNLEEKATVNDNTFQNINDVVAEIVNRVTQKHSLSKKLSLPALVADTKTALQELIAEFEAKGETEVVEFLKEHAEKILGENGNFDNSVLEYLSAILNTTDIEDFLELQGENVKDFDASSFEINTVDNLSGRIRLAFSNIKDTTRPAGFAGLQSAMSTADILDAIHQILSEIPDNDLASIKKYVDEIVEMSGEGLEFFQEIYKRIEMLNSTSPELVNQMLYSLSQPKTHMKFVMWNSKKDGGYSVDSYNANVKDPLFRKRDTWKNNLVANGLIDMYEENFFKINEEAAKEVGELYRKLKLEGYDTTLTDGIDKISKKDLAKFLGYFGIELNDTTTSILFRERDNDIFKNKNVNIDLEKALLEGKQSIVSQLYNNMIKAKTLQDVGHKLAVRDNVPEGTKADLLLDSNSRVLDLIHFDNASEFHTMGVMRIAGKNIYMYQQPNNILNRVQNLKEAIKGFMETGEFSGVLAELENTPITSESMLIDMIKSNPHEALKTFDTFLISLEALKKSGAKSRNDLGMTSLAEKDNFITRFGMFASSEGSFSTGLNSPYGESVALRKGSMFFPTISDSSQLPFLKTVMLDVRDSNIVGRTIDPNIIKVLSDKLVLSELKRTADYLTKVNASSNIEGYDAGAIWITSIPAMNTLQIEHNGYARPLIEVFRNHIAQGGTVEQFMKRYEADINVGLNDYFNRKADRYFDSKGEGKFKSLELVDNQGNFKIQNSTTKGKNARTVALDYVINTYLQQKEIQNVFAGDLAQYFKNKMVSTEVINGEKVRQLKHGLPIVGFNDILKYHYKSPRQTARIKEILGGKDIKDVDGETLAILLEEFPQFKYLDSIIDENIDPEEAYQNTLPIASQKLIEMFKGVQNNLSKRLKGQISPGSRYTHLKSRHDYIQIMISDIENASETIEELIRRSPDYGYLMQDANFVKELQEFKKLDALYHKDDVASKRHKVLYDKISKKIPNISAYLKTASTDAQEYTSWQENLNQLEVQGRISKEAKNVIEAKLNAQTKDIEETGTIRPENRLTQEEMQEMVMQPTKPLYAGVVPTTVGNGHNVSRFVYIKSSSFPLVPELTLMFPKLDAMRRNIEKIQENNPGKMVRLSYQSANKVGAVNTPVNVADLYQDPKSFESSEAHNKYLGDILQRSSIVLPRENFFIQQDKPFKADKNAKAGKLDTVTRATQFEKILLGDGINKIKDHVFPATSFDSKLLKELGIKMENNMINGPALKAIYNEIYRREQNIKMQSFFNKLGIKDYSDVANGKIEVMEKLARMFNEQLTNKQDKQALELLYLVKVPAGNNVVRETFLTKAELKDSPYPAEKAIFRMPLHMTPNSRKMESVANSLINKNNINLKMPGFSSPVASQEGFDYRGYMDQNISPSQVIDLLLSENKVSKINC